MYAKIGWKLAKRATVILSSANNLCSLLIILFCFTGLNCLHVAIQFQLYEIAAYYISRGMVCMYVCPVHPRIFILSQNIILL